MYRLLVSAFNSMSTLISEYLSGSVLIIYTPLIIKFFKAGSLKSDEK